VADPDTFAKAADVLRARGLWDRVPDGVRAHLAYGLAGQVTETIKPGASALARARTHVVGSVRDALSAARAEAERLGYAATVVSDRLTGEARAVGAAVTQALVDAAESADAAAGPRALLWGGETTVTVRGAGVGGRNQELALAAAMALDAWRHDRPAAAARFDAAVLSGGTDGVDGPTDAAGAVVTPRTVADAAARGLDARVALAANDSHPLLDAAGALLRPGPTHTNVMDVQIALLRPRGPE
jgi:hydroxypyruvate reductase